MRVTYQSGEVYLSVTKEEADHIHENKGKPVPIGVRTLKILHEDVSNCVKAHWSNVKVWEAVEEHLRSQKNTTKQ